MATSFAQAGNLAFYDGWSPDYVYFKSLTKYAWANSKSNKTKNAWNVNLAGERAATAAMDAVSHSVLPGMTQEQHDNYFLTKMQQIVAFLQKAIAYEYANEKEYFDIMLKELRKNFTKEEREKIKEIKDLEDTINTSSESGIVPKDKINTLCNLILQGQDNIKTVLNMEAKRVEAVQKQVEHIIKGRGNQAAGVGYSKGKSKELQEIMRENAQERLQRKYLKEYTEKKRLDLIDKKTGNAILYGGKSIHEIADQTISKHFADWVEKMVQTVSADSQFINKLAKKVENQYPVDGNFKLLLDDVQESIIQIIIDTGLHNLKETINKDLSNELIKHVEKNIIKNIDDNGVLDITTQLNITNLDNTYGRNIKEPELLKNITSISEMEGPFAKKLFSFIRKLMEENKDVIQKNPNNSSSYLIQAMSKSSAVTGETILERTNNIIEIINEIENIRKELNKLQSKYNEKLKKLHKTEIDYQKDIKLSKKSKATLTVRVINGKVEIDQNSLIAALKNDNRYQSFNLKAFNPQTLTSTLQVLKSRASKILQQDIINALKNSKFNISESELIEHVRQELRSMDIFIDGPGLAELITALQFRQSSNGEVTWNQKGIKNDSVHILINPSKARGKALTYVEYDPQINVYETAIQEAQNRLLKEYQRVIDQQASSLQKSGERYSKMEQVMDTDILNREDKDEELINAYTTYEEEVNKYIAYLKSAGGKDDPKTQRAIEKYRTEFLNVLQSSFYVSTTVKSHNDYVNQLGFVGGNIGGHLDQQLSNIADIFSCAGLEIPSGDLIWLKSAIINCFPGSMVGEKNKDMIEQYLGSLMAFALFDEGGIEAQIINNLSDKIIQTGKHKSRKILHLYNVNGIYVTGSTVLKRTLDSIQQDVITNIQKIPQKIGAGITIINSASESMIPNRPYEDYINSADENAWLSTGILVSQNVQLKILFLAGLLDIMNSINESLGNIETG